MKNHFMMFVAVTAAITVSGIFILSVQRRWRKEDQEEALTQMRHAAENRGPVGFAARA